MLKENVEGFDEVDLNGWLLRLLLPELHEMGEKLHSAVPPGGCGPDTERFATWLTDLARRTPGDDTVRLAHEGPFIRVVAVFVANRARLSEEGTEPYRKRAKSLIYSGRFDAVYLMARDANIPAVEEIYARLATDGRVGDHWIWRYRLRSDFASRRLPREYAVLACLRVRARGTRSTDAGEDLPAVEVALAPEPVPAIAG